MKKAIYLSASAIALFAAAPVFAQSNDSTVDQNGTSNQATVDQTGGLAGNSVINQGTNPDGYAADNSYATVTQSDTSSGWHGDANRSTINQTGSGMNATVSSIHVNGWYGAHNKLAGARWAVRELLGRDLEAELDRWVYVGDSTNDVLMFQHFPHSVGVANIRRFEAQLAFKPRYVTEGERGAGFAELARAILAARG